VYWIDLLPKPILLRGQGCHWTPEWHRPPTRRAVFFFDGNAQSVFRTRSRLRIETISVVPIPFNGISSLCWMITRAFSTVSKLGVIQKQRK